MFKTASWDNDAQGSEMCNDLFKASKKQSKNKKPKSDKFKKKHQNKISDGIKKVLKKQKMGEILDNKNVGNKITSKTVFDDTLKKKKKKKHRENINNNDNNKPGEPLVNGSPKMKKKKNKDSLGKSTIVENVTNNDKPKKKKKKNKDSLGRNTINENVTEIFNHDKPKKKKKKNIEEFQSNTSVVPNQVTEITPKSKLKKKKKKPAIINGANIDPQKNKIKSKLLRLKEEVQSKLGSEGKKPEKLLSLRERMMLKLKAARFRYLNEQIYTTTGSEAQGIFKQDPEAFEAYHEGYRQQVEKWPVNPVDVIIKSVRKMPKTHIVADFGCGEAKLAKSVPHTVHSFDLVASDDSVIACDMSHVPLEEHSIDVAVFCLSLMGTNLQDYLLEANRVLKVGGLLKIAEVESRFDNIDNFIEGVERLGFKKTWKDLNHNLFYFLDFKKENSVKGKKKLPTISLQPCLYKKR